MGGLLRPSAAHYRGIVGARSLAEVLAMLCEAWLAGTGLEMAVSSLEVIDCYGCMLKFGESNAHDERTLESFTSVATTSIHRFPCAWATGSVEPGSSGLSTASLLAASTAAHRGVLMVG